MPFQAMFTIQTHILNVHCNRWKVNAISEQSITRLELSI